MTSLSEQLAATDPSDWVTLQELTEQMGHLGGERQAVEEQWLDLGTRLEGGALT